MKFKVGQKVFLLKNHGATGARKGATAIVTRENRKEFGYEYIDVKWIRNDLSNRQGNGGYYSSDFKLDLKDGEQLLFDFMGDY